MRKTKQTQNKKFCRVQHVCGLVITFNLIFLVQILKGRNIIGVTFYASHLQGTIIPGPLRQRSSSSNFFYSTLNASLIAL